MRKCIFCLAKANSLEDALPHWITDQFKASEPCKAQLERHGAKVNIWHVYQPELSIRCVCQSCNNGWMSDLESQTKIYLQPLLMGEKCVLDISGQTTIALWSLKTAMVIEALDPPQQRMYTQQEHEQLQKLSVIPWRTSVWLAASVDQSLFLSTKNRHMGKGDTNDISGVSITMAFSHVVIQVFTIRVPPEVGPSTCVKTNVRRGPWEQATIQIWPAKPAPVMWPPPLALNSEVGLDALAERFSTTILDENDVESLIV
jgi:hypothetical protein